MKYLPGNPSTEDKFGFEPYIKTFSAHLRDLKAIEPPFTMAVYAPWGSGKSSFMEQLKEAVEKDEALKKYYVPIEFSPWSYQNEPNLIVPLILNILEQTKGLKAHLAQAKEAIRALTGQVVRTGFHILERSFLSFIASEVIAKKWFAKKLEKGESLVQTVDEAWLSQKNLSDLAQRLELMKRLIVTVAGEKRLLVFIDDLDRCHPPDRIVELLEQIKVFLSVDQCVFVLAVDKAVVVDAIDKKFPGQGEFYLEKFVQFALHLPPFHADALVRVYGDEIKGELASYLARIVGLLPHPNNPRSAQIFLNAFNFFKDKNLDADNKLDPFLLAKWLFLREVSPAVKNDPYKIIEIENKLERHGAFFKDANEMKEMEEKFGLREDAVAFLYTHREKAFKTPVALARYLRLDERDYSQMAIELELLTLKGMPLPEWPYEGADLSYAYFGGCDFKGKNFRGANLSHADMTGAKLGPDADFSEADFSGAKLAGAVLSESSFNAATFNGADLTGAKLGPDTDLQSADFSGAKLDSADFTGAVVGGTRLWSADGVGNIFADAETFYKLAKDHFDQLVRLSSDDAKKLPLSVLDDFFKKAYYSAQQENNGSLEAVVKETYRAFDDWKSRQGRG